MTSRARSWASPPSARWRDAQARASAAPVFTGAWRWRCAVCRDCVRGGELHPGAAGEATVVTRFGQPVRVLLEPGPRVASAGADRSGGAGRSASAYDLQRLAGRRHARRLADHRAGLCGVARRRRSERRAPFRARRGQPSPMKPRSKFARCWARRCKPRRRGSILRRWSTRIRRKVRIAAFEDALRARSMRSCTRPMACMSCRWASSA